MSPEIAIRIEIVTGLNAKLLLTLDFNYQLEQLEQMKKVERPELIKYDWAEAQLIIKEGNEELIVTYDYIKVDREVAIEASKRLVVDSIWKIANIELTRGVTLPQTQEIYEGRSPKNVDVETVVVIKNLKYAWQFLFENIDYPIDYQLISEYNNIVGAGHYSNPGKLKSEFVFISGTNYKPDIPNYESVKEEIERLNILQNPIDRGMEMLASISRGQWFNNGNKRTA